MTQVGRLAFGCPLAEGQREGGRGEGGKVRGGEKRGEDALM